MLNRLRDATRRRANWLPAVFLLLLAAFLLRERGEIDRTLRALRAADPAWAALALGVGLLIHVVLGLTFAPIMRRLRQRVQWPALVRAHLQRHVVGTVVPLGGPASLLAFTRALEREGVDADDAFFAALINGLLGYASLLLFLLPALALAALAGHVSGLIVAGAALLLIIFAGMLLGMLLLTRGGARSAGALARLPGRPAARLAGFVAQARGHGLRARDIPPLLAPQPLVDILGSAALFACLRAVGWQASPAEAVVGYAVGTLFLMLAPVFQGIGAVELSMTVALTGFGVPSEVALAAVLLYRAAETWLPCVLGVSMQAGERPELRRASAHAPALLTALTGALAVLSVLAPPLGRRFDRLSDYSLADPTDLSRHLTLIAGFFLIVLSYNLWRRKRVAWLSACALLAITIPAHLLKRHDQIGAVFSAFNLLLLLLHRSRFRVRSDLPTIRQGAVRFCASLIFAVGYGTLGFFLISRRAFGLNFTFADAVYRTLRAFFNLGDAGLTPRTRYGDWFLDSLSIVGVLAGSYALFALARPVVWRRRTLPAERERAAALIERHGDSALDYFKHQPDKVFFFSSTGRGVVAYRVALGCAVALGDPVAADDAEFARVLREFLDFCDANDWRVAFHQVPPKRLPAYHASGLAALKIGEDAVVDLATFSLAGRPMKHLRATVNRFEREGYRVAWRPPPFDDALLAQLREVSDEWLTIEGRRERGFTLGQFTEDYLRATPIVTVEDAGGRVVAFANLIPDGAPGEATIDLMRRRREPGGSMDFLYARLFERLRAEGCHAFALGMAPFAEVGTESGAPIPERALRLFYERFNRFFAYRGLRAYKDKFGPTWEPRYIVYQSDVALPAIALALIRLTEAGDLPPRAPYRHPARAEAPAGARA